MRKLLQFDEYDRSIRNLVPELFLQHIAKFHFVFENLFLHNTPIIFIDNQQPPKKKTHHPYIRETNQTRRAHYIQQRFRSWISSNVHDQLIVLNHLTVIKNENQLVK